MHVIDHARRGDNHHQQRHVRPTELGELILVRALVQRQYKCAEADRPEDEGLE